MKTLPIVWQRLVSNDGRTCLRCDATHQHLGRAVAKLRVVLKPLDIEPALEVREIDEGSFRKETGEANRIWISGKRIEEWLGAGSGSSRCCSVCGNAPCRTMEMEVMSSDSHFGYRFVVFMGTLSISRGKTP